MPPKHAAYHSIVQPCANESLPRRPPRGVIPSLAVLPFQNLSGEPEQQYFPNGITEDIIAELSSSRSLSLLLGTPRFSISKKTCVGSRVTSHCGRSKPNASLFPVRGRLHSRA